MVCLNTQFWLPATWNYYQATETNEPILFPTGSFHKTQCNINNWHGWMTLTWCLLLHLIFLPCQVIDVPGSTACRSGICQQLDTFRYTVPNITIVILSVLCNSLSIADHFCNSMWFLNFLTAKRIWSMWLSLDTY